MDYTVEYYEKDDGSRPAEEFIFSQDNVFLLYSMIQLDDPTRGHAKLFFYFVAI